MKKNLLTVLLIASAGVLPAQSWQEMMAQPGRNFYEIQAAFNEYWKDRDITVKGEGYKPFRRWEHFAERRVYPTGDLSLLSGTWENFRRFEGMNASKSSLQSSSTWTPIGPMGAMSGLLNGLPRNAGRDNFITFHPGSNTSYWAGAPAGGLWKTTNNGTSWSTNTDFLTVIGCSDLAIDPTNPNIMYLATGDGDASDTYCIGVLKSTDGGATWNPTGLTFPVTLQRLMRRIIIDPANTQVLLAATNVGIYRSTDGGGTWNVVNSMNTFDLEFKPGDPSVVYAAGPQFFRSTNNGASFSLVNSGIASGGVNRMAIAVTAADSNMVYVVASNGSSNGLNGVYRSNNSGASFVLAASSPNLLANSCAGTGTQGQGWYDLAIAASPLNSSVVAVGGVNVWRSTNGGNNFSVIGCWNSTNPAYVHADIHDLDYNSAGELYTACDGGIFSYNGSLWTDRTGTRNIAQIYKIGLSSLTPYRWITGHQDNGTNVYNGTTYNASIGGDGMDCFIDRTNDNMMFGSLYYGDFRRSGNGGGSWVQITSGMTGNAPWVSPWKQDPVQASRIYAGRTQLFVSNNLGTSWTQAGTIPSAGYVEEFAIAPSNNQVIYVIKGISVYKTVNGGTTWTSVNGTLPVSSAAASYLTVHPYDENTVWVTFSGYLNGSKVYKTTNGGANWTNITGNLPNLPANCSVYQPNSSGRIYVGMDVGVYYRDNSSTGWTLYNNGLPNTPISDMEISPAAPTKLRAATYGRSVYEVDVVVSSLPPVSAYTVSGAICSGVPKKFLDISAEDPASWSWSVSPSAGVLISSASVPNPSITFPSGGSYVVTMQASNANGAGSVVSQIINVDQTPILLFSDSSPTVCVGDDVNINVSGADSYTWMPGQNFTGTLNLLASASANYTVTGKTAAGCTATVTLDLVVDPCTGLPQLAAEGFSLFPNPAKNELVIHTGGAATKAALEILDATGKLVLSQDIHFGKGSCRIDISSLAEGVYMVKIRPEGGEVMRVKVVKE